MRKAASNTTPTYEVTTNQTYAGKQETIEVCWLPSLPLTQKHKAPPVEGLGILYSEELDEVLQVFETGNLQRDIKKFSMTQTTALNIDPDCRLHWLEISNAGDRERIRRALQSKVRSTIMRIV